MDRNSPQARLELSGWSWTVSRDSIGDVPIDVSDVLRELADCIRPQLDLMRPIHLYARVVDDVAIRTHPSDVREIRRRSRCETHHYLPRNPAAVSQSQSDVVLSEQSQHAFRDPATVSELDRDLQILRHPTQKIDQRRQLAWLEVGSHLHEHGSELVPEFARSLKERLRRTGSVAEPLLVGDLLRQFQSEDEPSRRTIVPAANGGRCR